MKKSEDKANQLLESLFSRTRDTLSIVEELLTFKGSQDTEQGEIISAVYSSVFQEFKFLSQYPEPELYTLSSFLAACVNNSLFSERDLDAILRQVTELFKTPRDSNAFKFSYSFISSLSLEARENPKIYSVLSSNSDISESLLSPNSDMDKDAVLVHLNNLTEVNVEDKARTVFGPFNSKDTFWLIETCIQRSMKEPNYMSTYVQLFRLLGPQKLELLVSRSLLEATKSFSQVSSQKNLYKNLGMWVGKLTLSLNRPILWKEMNLGHLFYNMKDEEGLKNAVIFTCNLLKQVKSSIFKPKNPWTMSIIVLLYSLCYSENSPNLFRYEFELLLKSLRVSLSDVRSAHVPILDNYADHSAIKNMCLLACIFVLKDNFDRVYGRCLKISEDTYTFLFQKDRKYASAQSLETACKYCFLSFLYVSCKEFLKDHCLEFIKTVFSDLSISFEEKDMFPHLAAAVDQVCAFLYACHLPELPLECGVLPVSKVLDTFSILAEDIHHTNDDAVHKWWQSPPESVYDEIIALSKSCEFSPISPKSSSDMTNMLTDLISNCCSLDFDSPSYITTFNHQHQQLSLLLTQVQWSDDVLLSCCQKLMQTIFKSTSAVATESLSNVLHSFVAVSTKCSSECLGAAFRSDTCIIYSPIAFRALLNQKIIPYVFADIFIANVLEKSPSTEFVDFSLELCELLYPHDPQDYTLSFLILTIEWFASQHQNPKWAHKHAQIESLLSKVGSFKKLRPDIVINLQEWLVLSYASDERYQKGFITSLSSKLSGLDISVLASSVHAIVESALMICHEYSSITDFAAQVLSASVKLLVSLAINSDKQAQFIEACLSSAGRALLKFSNSSPDPSLEFLKRFIDGLDKGLPSCLDLCHVLLSFLQAMSPNQVPHFSIPWLDLLGRRFMIRSISEDYSLLSSSALACIKEVCALLSSKYFESLPPDTKQLVYTGLVNLFVVVAHDIPQLFTENFESLLCKLPVDARQLRNLVLSCIPKNVKLPDPFTIRLSSLDFSSEDRSTQELYSSPMRYPKIYPSLLNSFDGSALLNIDDQQALLLADATCDNLRYPSKFTIRNIHLILSIYEHSNSQIRETIVTSILERLVVHKPHPWGLMVAFLELIRNDKYKFWSENFINLSVDIRNLFDSIAKTCLNA